jgi:predicted Zn-dependent protease
MVGQIGQAANIGLGVGQAVTDKPSFTDESEARMAQAEAQKFEQQNKLLADPLLDGYLTEITQKIVTVSKPKPYVYRTRPGADATINAFTFGGGILYFNAGLIARVENEAQLSMVMGHEIAHVTERHIPRGIERRWGVGVLGGLASTGARATGYGHAIDQAFDYSMNAAVNGHGRALESEADEVGLEYMVKAGYDPREAPVVFEIFLKEFGDPPPLKHFFYGSHPANVERIERVGGLVKAKYQNEAAARRLVVNTEEFKRRTRQVVIAVGRLDYENKRFNTSQAMFQKAIRADERDPVPHYYLGKIAQETGAGQSIDQALDHFARAIKVDAKYAPAYREMGLAFYRRSERAKAIQALERYLALEPQAPDAAAIRNAIAELRRY